MQRLFVFISALFVICRSVYAIDLYQGMLGKQDEQYLFFPCGHKDTPMQITFANHMQIEDINSTFKLLDKHKLVQVSVFADVKVNGNKAPYEFTIHIMEFRHVRIDSSCHLTDYLENMSKNIE